MRFVSSHPTFLRVPLFGTVLSSKITVIAIFGLFLAAAPFALTIENSDFYKAYFPAGDSVLRTGTFQYATDGFKSFANLPLLAYLFVPLAWLGRDTAGAVFLASEVVIYFVTFLVALRYISKSYVDNWVLLFLFVFSRHYYTSIQFGQLTILTFLFIVLAFIAYQKKRAYLTGALLAGAFLVKIPAGFLVLYFLFKRESRTVGASAVTYLSIVIISLIAFGLQLHLVYFDYTVLSNAGTTLTAYNNPSLSAFAMRFIRPEGLFDWQLISVPTYISFAVSASIVILITYLARTIGLGRRDEWDVRKLEFSMALCASLVVFPLLWDHYYLFMILPMFVAYEVIRDSDKKAVQAGLWAVSLVLVNLPVLSLVNANMGVLPFLAGFVSHPAARAIIPSSPLFGSLVMLSLLVHQYRYVRANLERSVPVQAGSPAQVGIASNSESQYSPRAV